MVLSLGGNTLIKVLMNGCNGKMGQTIASLLEEDIDIKIVAGVDKHPDRYINAFPVYYNINEAREDIDVLVDFSNPSSLPEILDYGINKRTAMVVATTGLSQDDYERLRQASELIPLFVSANMSIGINILLDLVGDAASAMHNSFDIEIIEKHHNEKKDAPSGTALMLADEINDKLNNKMHYIYDRSTTSDKRDKNDIGILSVRAGSIPGEHTIIFAGQDEILEIKHTALSRKIFAKGTLEAVKYISNKSNGLYNMRTLLKELKENE